MVLRVGRAQIVGSLLVLLFSPASSAQQTERYFAWNPEGQGALELVGISDGTDYSVRDLGADTLIEEGTIDHLDVHHVDVGGATHFVVEAAEPLLAYLGYDCCAVAGTTFIPTTGGHSRVGRSFVLYVPFLGLSAELYVFAVESARVVLQDESGETVAARQVAAGEGWRPYPYVGGRAYELVSDGDVTVQVSTSNGLTSVPPASHDEACDGDVGRQFLFATHSWGDGAMAAVSYESEALSLSLYPLYSDTPTTTATLAPGELFFTRYLGKAPYRVSATGDVAVWAGDLEGGETADFIGDDFAQIVGRAGGHLRVPGFNHGAVLFATAPDTTVSGVGETAVTVGDGEWLELPAGEVTTVDALAPVVAHAYGGNTLNDWGGFLRPAPRAAPVCLRQDRPVPFLDGGVPGDADPDSSAVDADWGDSDAGMDGDNDLQDGGEPSEELQPRGSCDCSASGGLGGGARLLGSVLLALLG